MTQKKKVAALMTAPRYECVWARNKIDLALQKNGIPLTVSGGVFYGQCMQRMLKDVVEKGVDYALTIDFDSIFEPVDVANLIARANERDDIDALAAVQSRRGMKYPLFTKGQSTLVEFEGEPVQVDTAHFGLTLIKLDALRTVPRPWFWSTPAEGGEWENNKIDDDIYFWHKWRDCGKTVFVDPAVSIGHLEEVVSYFDFDGQHQFSYTKEWDENRVVK